MRGRSIFGLPTPVVLVGAVLIALVLIGWGGSLLLTAHPSAGSAGAAPFNGYGDGTVNELFANPSGAPTPSAKGATDVTASAWPFVWVVGLILIFGFAALKFLSRKLNLNLSPTDGRIKVLEQRSLGAGGASIALIEVEGSTLLVGVSAQGGARLVADLTAADRAFPGVPAVPRTGEEIASEALRRAQAERSDR